MLSDEPPISCDVCHTAGGCRGVFVMWSEMKDAVCGSNHFGMIASGVD